ncbi:MAG TPA: YceI family protein [Gemmatimonadales bacterium]|nr:YceI family protein [Gemmatimonadales bacterium]
MKPFLLLALLQAAQPAPPASAPTNAWSADPAHSAVGFRVRHLGIAWVNGTFKQWTADVKYDPANPEAATVVARIQTASIDTDNERRDNDLRSSNYLAADSFPEITFTSKKVERAGEGRLRITGDLTIRGVTRSVVLDTEVGGVLSTSRGRRTAFTASTTIKRQDYGVTLNNLMEGAQVVGDDVRITIDVEARER